MAFNLENFKNQPLIAVIRDEDIRGLSLFKKRLEQLFFSDVVIRNSNGNKESAKLNIEVSCNFNLWEGMSSLKSGIWAQFRKPSDEIFATSEFYNLVIQLQKQNDFPIEVEEFSIIFDNCNIIINKIHEFSIPEQLDLILTKIAEHYPVVTKDMREVPYEIFIPVFEEVPYLDPFSESLTPGLVKDKNTMIDYFSYWGLYFYSDEDATIYNLEKEAMVDGELNMFNDLIR